MSSGKSSDNENLNTDVAIVGGGGAGLSAAVVAAEKGANVILLEKGRSPGGNSALAEGLFAAESPTQKRMRIDARRDELFKVAMDYAHLTIDARLVRAFVDKSGDTIRWLEDKGIAFNIYPLWPNQVPLVWHCPAKGGGSEVIKMLAGNCEKFGVRIICETRARELLTGDKKRVTGLLATGKGGGELKITAKSVIIATGGYGGNKELLSKYYPHYNENLHHVGFSNMGDGLLMATKIGAATEGLGVLHFSGTIVPGEPRSLMVVAEEPNTVWVNRKGRRYIDEANSFNRFRSVNAVIRQPDSVSYTLFDEDLKKNILENGVVKGYGLSYFPGAKLDNLEKELKSAEDRGNVKVADSWEGIAAWIGASLETLKATVNEYNAGCDRGYDDLFAKERRYLVALRRPPYYAIRCYPRFLGTIGGIKINHDMEVLDSAADPISGLYAAGIDTGGWESGSYCAALSGSTFGFAINSGRIAGENAAKYVLGK